MKFIYSIAASLLLCLSSGTVLSDQNNPALDGLFVDLKRAPTPVAASKTASAIWDIWIYHESDDDINKLMQIGMSAMQSGNLRLADRLFTDAIALDGAFAEAWNKRATVRFQLGLFARSRADIAETLKLEDRHFGALAGLGIVEIHLDNPEAALRAYKAALALYPQMSDVESIIEKLEKQVLGQPL